MEVTEQGRRRKKVPISPDLLYGLFTVGPPQYVQCIEGLPEKARFIGLSYDVQCDVYYLVFEADEWESVLFGHELPILRVVLRSFPVVSLLTRAEMMIAAAYGDDADRWLREWREIRGDLVEE